MLTTVTELAAQAGSKLDLTPTSATSGSPSPNPATKPPDPAHPVSLFSFPTGPKSPPWQ